MEDKEIPKDILDQLEWVQENEIYGYYKIRDEVKSTPCEDCGKILKTRNFKVYKKKSLLCRGCNMMYNPETGCYDINPNNEYQQAYQRYKRGESEMIWITNGETSQKVSRREPIPQGWQRGRKLKKK